MLIIKSFLRKKIGTKNNNLIRLNKKIPANIYGNKKESINILLNNNNIFFKKNIYSLIFKIKIFNFIEKALIKKIQFHAYKKIILHIDFQRINEFKKINVKIPINFINSDICPAVKLFSGIINYICNEINIVCLPKYLPKFIIVDLLQLNINDSICLFDLKLSKGLFFKNKNNITIVTSYLSKNKNIENKKKLEKKKK